MLFNRPSFFSLCFLCMCCLCAADVDVVDKQRVGMILSALDDSRMRINTGVCNITGNLSRGSDNITIAFDYHKGFYRFDQNENKRSLRTPDYYYESLDEHHPVTRQGTHDFSPSWQIKPFDIRGLGFFSLTGPSWRRDYVKDERKCLFEDNPVSLEESANGVFVITFERTTENPPPIIRKYWIDSGQGFSLIRGEYGETVTIDMSWKEINETWVPTSFKLSSADRNQSAEWKIDWLIVNEDVPEHYFDPNLLSNEGTYLVSVELEQPIIIGDIRKGQELPGPLYVPEERRSSHFRNILMYLGIFFIVLGLGKKLYDYLRKRAPK